jgi:hypothetical protein
VQPQPPHPVSLHPRYCIWGCSQLGKYRVWPPCITLVGGTSRRHMKQED